MQREKAPYGARRVSRAAGINYLYVLAVDGPSPHVRMTALSMLSARAWDAAAHVTLITDARSLGALTPIERNVGECLVHSAAQSVL